MIIFCFARMLRVIYKQNQAPTFLRQQLRLNKRREKVLFPCFLSSVELISVAFLQLF